MNTQVHPAFWASFDALLKTPSVKLHLTPQEARVVYLALNDFISVRENMDTYIHLVRIGQAVMDKLTPDEQPAQ